MNTQTLYKFSLDTSGKKIICPGCGQKRAVRYKNNETGEFFPNKVSRCDRENSCGYHFTPKQYLTDIGIGHVPSVTKKEDVVTETKIDFMPLEYIEKSMYGYDETNFAKYLIDLFGFQIVKKALRKYFVGRSRNDNGTACIFWRIDYEGNLRTGKIMCYNPQTGKRNKEINPTWVHAKMNSFNYRLCFFGEHLISEYPDATIGITESEKTAIIASIFMPDIVWIATGGSSGCKWREYQVYKVLEGRKIILFPDFGFYSRPKSKPEKEWKTCYSEWSDRAAHIRETLSCDITVSELLEKNLGEEYREDGPDLADFLVKKDPSTSLALTDEGYPAIWDFNCAM